MANFGDNRFGPQGGIGYEPGTTSPTRRALYDIKRQVIQLWQNLLPDAPADGKTYGREDNNWVEVTGGGGGVTEHDQLLGVTPDQHHAELHDLDSHTDVVAPAPTAQQVLTYNAIQGYWEPRTPIGALGIVAFGYRFDDSLAGPVAPGDVQFNNADPALVTEIYVSRLDEGNEDIELFFEYLQVGDWFNIADRNDYQANHHAYDVSGPPVDNGDWWTVPVTLFQNVGPAFSNNEQVNLVIRYGQGGGGGGSDGFTYVQDTEPIGAETGQTWWNTETGQSFIWFDGFWIQFAPGGGGGGRPRMPDVIRYTEPGSFSFDKSAFPEAIGIRVTMIGAGAGGGGAGPTVASQSATGGAGGAGATIEKLIVIDDLSLSEPIVVGAAGTGGVGVNNGTDGGNTTAFGSTAFGGVLGRGAAGTVATFAAALGGGASADPDDSGVGSTVFKTRGQPGGWGMGTEQRNAGGIGGHSTHGNGGTPGNALTAVGSDGGQGGTGGGGGGGANRPNQTESRKGGDGGNGEVVIEVLYGITGGGGGDTTTSGSNANGNWVKYPDGTMQCWRVWQEDVALDAPYLGLYLNSSLVVWTFPLPFIEEPVITVGRAQWGSSASWGQALDGFSTFGRIRIWDAQTRASGNTNLTASAIGRWF